MKFFAPWCRACKGLEPKYKRVANAGDAKDVVFAQFDVQHNKKFVKSLGILALPNVHFYSGGESSKVLESFPCGPSKVPILKKKLGEVRRRAGAKRQLELYLTYFPLASLIAGG